MPDFQIIQSISNALRRQIVTTLNEAPGVAFGLGDDLDRISLEPPDASFGDSVVASLYLYHIDIDGHLRNQPMVPDRGAEDLFHRPPLPLRLHYLLTPLGAEDGTNQVISALVLQHVQDNPRFNTLGDTLLDDAQGAAPISLKLRFNPLSPEAKTQLWSALNTALRLSLCLVVEVVGLESARPPQTVPRIGQVAARYGQASRGASDGQ